MKYMHYCHTVQIRDFHHKMKNWPPTRFINTLHFQVQDLDLCLCVYPNGMSYADIGNVSVYLMNVTPKQIFLSCTFQIGQEEERLWRGDIKPTSGWGSSNFCSHLLKFPNYKPDEELRVTCRIMNLTTDKVVWDLYHETKVELVQTVAKLHKAEMQLLESRMKLDETRTKLDDTQSKLEEVRLEADQTQMKLEEIQQNFDETWVKIDETKALLNVTKKRLAWKEHALHKLDNVNNN